MAEGSDKEQTGASDDAPREDEQARPGFRKITIQLPRPLLVLGVLGLLLFAGVDTLHRWSTARRLARRAERQEALNDYEMVLETPSGKRLSDKIGDLVVVMDPVRGYRSRGNQKKPHFSTNSLGYRGGREWSLKKSPGQRRVMILGSSMVFGHGASADEKVFTAVLERSLGCEVLNAGVSGTTSTQDFIHFSTELLAYEPDLVLIISGFNDFHFAGLWPDSRRVDDLCFPQVVARLEAAPPSQSIFRYSSLIDSLLRRIESASDGAAAINRIKLRGPETYYGLHPRALPDYLRNLELTATLAQAKKIKVLLAVQPEMHLRRGGATAQELSFELPKGYHDYSKAQYPSYLEGAKDLARRMGLEFFDARELFDQSSGEVFIDAVHLNDLGNEVLAKALEPRLRALLAGP